MWLDSSANQSLEYGFQDMASSSRTTQQAGKPSVCKIENESREDGFQVVSSRLGHLTVSLFVQVCLLRSPRICEEEDV